MTLVPPPRCSALADELGEPMAGTADARVRWLLVEDRSAWGEKAVRDVLGTELEAAAKERRMRLLLVRRREGDPADDAVRRAFLVDTARGEMAARTLTDVAELPSLLDVDLAAFGAPVTEPMFLVCTNGKRDACCALRGRAVVAALASDHGDRVWECTHLGGHRFAANLVCLPDGIVYGRVPPADAAALARDYLAGRVDPASMRGRSAWPAPAQVAEVALRTELGLTGMADVVLRDVAVDDDAATVELGLPDGAGRRLELVAKRLDPPRTISCRGDDLEGPLHWRVVSSGPADPSPGTG